VRNHLWKKFGIPRLKDALKNDEAVGFQNDLDEDNLGQG